MKMQELWHFDDRHGEGSGEVVVVEVEDLEGFQGGERRWEGFIEDVVREVEVSEVGDERERRWNRAREDIVGDGEVLEVFKETHVRGQSSGEIAAGDVDGDYDGAVGSIGGGANDAIPGAVVCGGCPRGQRVLWVVGNGGF